MPVSSHLLLLISLLLNRYSSHLHLLTCSTVLPLSLRCFFHAYPLTPIYTPKGRGLIILVYFLFYPHSLLSCPDKDTPFFLSFPQLLSQPTALYFRFILFFSITKTLQAKLETRDVTVSENLTTSLN
jgi:hypothetical protein